MQNKQTKTQNVLMKPRVYTLIRLNDEMGDAERMNYFELIINANVTEAGNKNIFPFTGEKNYANDKPTLFGKVITAVLPV